MLEKANTDRVDRRTARREATKAEIVAAAWELAREQGLAELSLRDLAARVGMRAPSLYQYFPSKNAIYDAMFKQAAEEFLAGPAVVHDDAGDARTEIKRGAHAFFAFAVSDPVRAQLLFQRPIAGFEPTPDAYAPAVAALNEVRSSFARLGIDDPETLDLFTAITSGLVSQQLANDPGGTRWERLIDRAVDMFCDNALPKTATKRRKENGQ